MREKIPETPPTVPEQPFREVALGKTPEHLLHLYFKQHPEVERLGDEPVEGYRDRRIAELRADIEKENELRGAEGIPPLSIVGIHAGGEGDAVSRSLLNGAMDEAEHTGARIKRVEMADAEGYPDRARIQEAVEQIKESEGFTITAHTSRGNSVFLSMLQHELEKVDLSGKVAGFYHTISSIEEDEAFGPAVRMQDFLESKGCVVLPYTAMFASVHPEDRQPWVEINAKNNGVYVAQGVEMMSRSPLKTLLKDPDIFNERNIRKEAEGGKMVVEKNPEWEALRERVHAANEGRSTEGREALSVLFIQGGKGHADSSGSPEEWGRGAWISKAAAESFEDLGFTSDTIHLPSIDIAPTSNPNPNLKDVEGDKVMSEIYEKMLKADVIIFSTPVRWATYSDALKRLVERSTPLERSGFLLDGKVMGTIITMGEAGAKETELSLKQWAHHTGMVAAPHASVKQRLTYVKDEYPGLHETFPAVHRLAGFSASTVVDLLEPKYKKGQTIGVKSLSHPRELFED